MNSGTNSTAMTMKNTFDARLFPETMNLPHSILVHSNRIGNIMPDSLGCNSVKAIANMPAAEKNCK